MQTKRIRVEGTRKEGKGYVAEISGVSDRYGLKREFLRAVERDGDEAVFALEPGKVYEVKNLDAAERHFVHLVAFDPERHVPSAGRYVDEGWMLDAENLVELLG